MGKSLGKSLIYRIKNAADLPSLIALIGEVNDVAHLTEVTKRFSNGLEINPTDADDKTAAKTEMDNYYKAMELAREHVNEINLALARDTPMFTGGSRKKKSKKHYIKSPKGKRLVHKGPRGGKYIVLNGKKKYLTKK